MLVHCKLLTDNNQMLSSLGSVGIILPLIGKFEMKMLVYESGLSLDLTACDWRTLCSSELNYSSILHIMMKQL